MSTHAPADVAIRPAATTDAAAIAVIYNHYVLHTLVTFEEEPVSTKTMAERMHDVNKAGLPWIVAELDRRLVGYAYATTWKPRHGYRFSVETSVYAAERGQRETAREVRLCQGGRVPGDRRQVRSVDAGGILAEALRVAVSIAAASPPAWTAP